MEPYSPTARAKASAKPVSTVGNKRRREDLDKRAQPARAQRGGGLLDFLLQILQHRLQRPHDERQAHKGQRDDNRERRIGAFDAERHEKTSEPAVRGEEAAQGQPRDGGGQREGKIHEGVNEAFAEKLIAHQDPREQRAKDSVDGRRNQRRAEREPERGEGRAAR